MYLSNKRLQWTAAAVSAILLLLSATWLFARDHKKIGKNNDPAASALDDRRRALHALNRLTFGPRPGDVDHVLAIGLDKWIDEQLSPQNIDDRQLEARLQPFRTLRMEPREMLENFPPPQVLKAVADGKMAMPRDPEKRAVYESGIERYHEQQQQRGSAEKNPTPRASGESAMADPQMEAPEEETMREARQQAREQAGRLLAMSADDRMDAILRMKPEERTDMVRNLNPEARLALIQGMDPKQKETLVAMANPQAVIVGELQQAKLIRAAYSERQLDEVMTDFWFNHFNVFINKGPDRYLVTAYERDVIRPRALGKFKDLLLATAKSPAMLFYLDNWQSVGPDSDAATGNGRTRPAVPLRTRGALGGGRPGMVRFPAPPRPAGTNKPQPPRVPRGLNENYAREIMELHTLGVNGGYTQKDVTELAKVLTGWTLRQPRRGGGYEFNVKMHEPGKKTVLGKRFKDEGEKEGEKAILMLARHPSTAKFISRKLAMRFVSDAPPESLVDRMAETFHKSDGDIRQVLRTMLHSPEFWAPEADRAKVKTPLEFVASAVRATGADVQSANALVQNLNKMGMPLYGAQPPTGYSMKAETWINSGALLDRMNFALALGAGRLPGIRFDTTRILDLGGDVPGDDAMALTGLEHTLLGGDASSQTHETIRKQMALQMPMEDQQAKGPGAGGARPVNLGIMAGAILGSPEFQRR